MLVVGGTIIFIFNFVVRKSNFTQFNIFVKFLYVFSTEENFGSVCKLLNADVAIHRSYVNFPTNHEQKKSDRDLACATERQNECACSADL